MKKVISIGSNSEIIKNIKHGTFSKEKKFVVDDLGILMQDNTKKSCIESFVFCDELIFNPETKNIRDYYIEHSENCYQVSAKVFDSISSKENSAGMIAIIAKKELTLDKALADKSDFVLVNDGIEIPGNMGTIFRTCDAVGCDLVINTSIKTSVYNPKVIHASRGTVLKVPFVNTTISEAGKFLIDNGYRIITCETLDGTSFDRADYSGKIAIVIGCERYGIDKAWFDFPHQNVYIPMYGQMTSLNVGVAGSIMLYQAKMTRK